MRAFVLAAASLAAVPSLSAAQLSNRAISLESGLSRPLVGKAPAAAAFAVSASQWLDGLDRADLDGVLRVAFSSAPETTGRGAAPGLLATAGLRLSLARAPLRPQLLAELGWARGPGGASRVAFGAGAALEWFLVPDLSLAARAGLRGAGTDLAGEGTLAVAAYF